MAKKRQKSEFRDIPNTDVCKERKSRITTVEFQGKLFGKILFFTCRLKIYIFNFFLKKN